MYLKDPSQWSFISIPKILFPSKAFAQKRVELLTSAAPAVMLALFALTVGVCYIMLLWQESSAVSRRTLVLWPVCKE